MANERGESRGDWERARSLCAPRYYRRGLSAAELIAEILIIHPPSDIERDWARYNRRAGLIFKVDAVSCRWSNRSQPNGLNVNEAAAVLETTLQHWRAGPSKTVLIGIALIIQFIPFRKYVCALTFSILDFIDNSTVIMQIYCGLVDTRINISSGYTFIFNCIINICNVIILQTVVLRLRPLYCNFSDANYYATYRHTDLSRPHENSWALADYAWNIRFDFRGIEFIISILSSYFYRLIIVQLKPRSNREFYFVFCSG